jgi:hypothetical protein
LMEWGIYNVHLGFDPNDAVAFEIKAIGNVDGTDEAEVGRDLATVLGPGCVCSGWGLC